MLKVAFRNIFRNTRRTIITFLMISIGSVLFSFVRFLAYGAHQDMIWHVVSLSSGFIQVAANGWHESRSIERALDVDETLLKSLRVEGVTAVSPRIFSHALISHGENSRFISVLAADPELEKNITVIHEKIKQGVDLSRTDDPYAAMIGYKLAKNLDLKLGDSAYLIGSQFDGSMGAIKINIAGIYKSINTELDISHVIIKPGAGRELFAPGSPSEGVIRYTSVALGVKDYRVADRVYRALVAKYPFPELEKGEAREESLNYGPVVLNWKDMNPGIIQAVLIDEIQNDFFWVFLLIVLAFGVLNNVQMSIHERVKEFGVLLAVGTNPRSLYAMVLYEVLIVLLPALFIGTLGGMGVGYYFNVNPIVFTGNFEQAYEELGFVPVIRSIVDPVEIWIAVLAVFVPCILFALFAIRRIFRLNPVEIIGTI